jgi:hypothetical protein
MKSIASLLLGFAGAIVLFPGSAAAADPDSASGFVSIFDGESLDGWAVIPSSTKEAWSVRDGMIVGKGVKLRSYLTYDRREIADFEMKLRYRFPGEGNSGISIRARVDETGKRGFQCYHADFGHLGIGKQVLGAWDFHTPGRTEHRCFRGDRLVIDRDDQPTITPIEGALSAADIRRGDWNDVHVIARGNRFTLRINGKPASEFTEHLPTSRRLLKGMIQLQLHDPGMVVHFKDLSIKIVK